MDIQSLTTVDLLSNSGPNVSVIKPNLSQLVGIAYMDPLIPLCSIIWINRY